ncbi:PTS system mannose/fructose/N-acetylgalactosamine-transporter subunit IIB [Lacticaseibacillus kribbianus]|uniref:PTS system mannose/fructose/N-acetylgalactosamine-transporter subunit IIB n=1 Tax=Lacticaseibacillus kribbianus TaxID=2926292 RepID=UPI001CD5E6E8|nr:PTS sugar transporter subunit IIB [Lacticaseibacillus kribbianus]
MSITFARIDERLVHGQIMTTWIKQYPADTILIVDDALAADDFTSSILAMSAPAGLTIAIQGVTAAAATLSAAGGEPVFVLFKTPQAALALSQAGVALVALNVGNLGSRPDRRPLTHRVFASDAEVAALRALAAAGTDVYLQMLPSDARQELGDVK